MTADEIAVGLVLAIACVNIANMLSVSGLARGRELAVKAALGASRGTLVRSLFTESAVLSGLGGLGGILLAWISMPVLVDLLPSSIPRTGDFTSTSAESGIVASLLAPHAAN